jgi:hypothetical protein
MLRLPFGAVEPLQAARINPATGQAFLTGEGVSLQVTDRRGHRALNLGNPNRQPVPVIAATVRPQGVPLPEARNESRRACERSSAPRCAGVSFSRS